jgi:hypothetical protein
MSKNAIVLHLTQGDSLAGAVATVIQRKVECHEVVDPARERPTPEGCLSQQVLPWSQAARSLAHPRGTPETNNRGYTTNTALLGKIFQIEVVGWSDRIYSPAWYARLARYLRLRCSQLDVPLAFPTAPFRPEHLAYGETKPGRLTRAQFRVVAGLIAHQDVPDNAHWDGGITFNPLVPLLTEGSPMTPDQTAIVMRMQQRLKDSGATLSLDGDPGEETDAALDAVLRYQQGEMQRLALELERAVQSAAMGAAEIVPALEQIIARIKAS